MTTWDIEQADHVFENTTWRPGPIVRSLVVDSEVGEDAPTDAPTEPPNDPEVARCPTCGERFPAIASACPDDGTPLPARPGRLG